MGFWGLTGEQFIDPAFQPVADFCLGLQIHMGVNIHGNLDAGMAKLALNILDVKDIGAFHAAGHIVAQHVKSGGNAQPVPRVAVVAAETGRAYGLAIKPCKDIACILPVRRFEPVFQLHLAVAGDFGAKVSGQGKAAVALLGFILLCMQSCGTEFTLTREGAAKDNVCMAYTAPAEDEVDRNGTSD